jgi:hypothetical protein
MTFSIPSKPLSRRRLLRGLGAGALVTVGLPRLNAMLNGNGDAYAAGAPLAKRFGVWFWGNGIIPQRWVPTNTGIGDAWTLSPQLMPYAKVKKNMTVLTGYELKVSGEAHRIGPAGALSGHKHDDARNYTAATIDHVIAGLIGTSSPFKSLVLGVSRATANGSGHCINYASSSGPGQPVMPEYDAKAVFERLFGKAMPPAEGDRSGTRRKRVLDVVMADAKDLRSKLGAEDQHRLEQHLDGVAQLESRISKLGASGAACQRPDATSFPPPVADLVGDPSPERNQAMSELTAYALSCDLTNVFLLQHGRPGAHYDMKALGIDKDIHDDISHKEPGDQPIMNSAELYWFNQGAVFMETLQNTPDGASNLLESSIVYATSDVSFGFNHSTSEYPLVLFGRGGGALKGDMHHRVNKENVSQLLFTLVNLFGGNVTSFGGGEGMVTKGIPEIVA